MNTQKRTALMLTFVLAFSCMSTTFAETTNQIDVPTDVVDVPTDVVDVPTDVVDVSTDVVDVPTDVVDVPADVVDVPADVVDVPTDVAQQTDTAQNTPAYAEFVKRMYQTSLGREAEAEGLAFYENALAQGKTGAWLTAVLFASDEYEARNRTNAEFLDDLYRGLFDREVDDSGLGHWLSALDDGMSRKWVIASSLPLPEVTETCESYGVEVGTYASDEWRDKNQNVTAFLSRLYRICLGRDADAEGLNAHAKNLLTQQTASDVALFFFTSDEFLAQEASSEAFASAAYNAFLDRTPDAEGLAYYVDLLDSGCSERLVLSQMAASPEFATLCKTYGIASGQIETTETRDDNPLATSFVSRLYTLCLERAFDVDGLNYYTALLQSNDATASSLAETFFTSDELIARDLTDEAFVAIAYQTFLDRTADDGGLTYYTDLLTHGASRLHALSLFSTSEEFATLCENYGIPCGEITSPDAEDAPIWGIDVSQYQNGTAIDWNAVKADGVEFVMVRAVSTNNYGLYEDPYFRTSVRGAKAAGIDVGVYYPLYGETVDECLREIGLMLNAMSALEAEGYRFDYPVAVDIEYNHGKLSKEMLTYLTQFSLIVLDQKGYYPLLYTYSDFAKYSLNMDTLQGYDVWIANYTGSVSYPAEYDMWQYTGKGSVDGIKGYVDLNYDYKDFGDVIRNTTNGKGEPWNKW